ncbi:MAG: DUF4832 domain-containing protein [Anaerolineales bacterium]
MQTKNQNKLLGFFNIIFFFVIIIVIVISLVVVMKSKDADKNPLNTNVQRTIELTATNNNPVQGNDNNDEVISALPTPSDDQLQKISLNENYSYLNNPGIGWINRWGDDDLTSIPTSLAYSSRSDIRWNVLNPEEGVYNWEPLDAQLNQAVGIGKQYAFRVYTMAGEIYGGQAVPKWVLRKGGLILPSGEPDYSNCVYQEEWGRFVEKLVERYDGNSNIAFIDISGYGDFNEWSWRDDQTIWDEVWEDQYEQGIAGPESMSNIDSQARRRLADIFIGGNYNGHVCQAEPAPLGRRVVAQQQSGLLQSRDKDTYLVDYNYPGFQKTQLVMPFAGIIQSSQYVYLKNSEIGFRHDCLGRPSSENILSNFGKELNQIWMKAPVVFETCQEDQFVLSSAYKLITEAHGSIIHNANLENIDQQEIVKITNIIGYRYFLSHIKHSKVVESGGQFFVSMNWLNVGNAPNYPKMGQVFSLHLYLLHETSGRLIEYEILDNLTDWLPSGDSGNIPSYLIEKSIKLPEDLKSGTYQVLISILNMRTGKPIKLAIDVDSVNGLYPLSSFEVNNS